MDAAGIDALLLTTEPEIRYFTGFLTRFWESPTRPWFLVLPRRGDVIAVIPSIGAELMGRAGVSDIRTWPSPRPDDDGTELLADALRENGPRIGIPSGPETHLRMPLDQYRSLRQRRADLTFGGDAGIVQHLRLVKSPAEIAKIAQACAIADRAFLRVPEIARPGVPLSHVFRDFPTPVPGRGRGPRALSCGRGGPGRL